MLPLLSIFMLSGPSHGELFLFFTRRFRRAKLDLLLNVPSALMVNFSMQFAAGPPVENGFYYDVDLPHRISPDDFEKIEAEMKKEIKANHPFERMEVSRDEALKLGKKGRLAALSERREPSKYKLDIIENIPLDEKISLYRSGEFVDLCAGPHV